MENKEQNKIIDIAKEIKSHKTVFLMKNQEKISKLKGMFCDEIIYDNPIKPEIATYTLTGNYIIISSPIVEKRKILLKYSSILIKHVGKTFFLLRLPDSSKVSFSLKTLLVMNEISIQRQFSITFENLKILFLNSNKKKLPYKWKDRIPLIKQDFLALYEEETTLYKYKENPAFPLYIEEKTVKEFVENNIYSPPYEVYIRFLKWHVASATGITGQVLIKKAIVSTNDIRKLIPSSISLDRILRESNISKFDKFLIFDYSGWISNKVYFYKYKNIEEKTLKQVLYVPYKLLSHVFKGESFGNKGWNYFLMVLFGYKFFRNPKVKYKPSTIIKIGKLNDKRGSSYTVRSIERPLIYFKKIGIISSYTTVTKELIKEDKAITIYLNPLKYWRPPK